MRVILATSYFGLHFLLLTSPAFAQDTSTNLTLLNQPKFVKCREKAIPIAKEGYLGICERQDHDDGLWYSNVPYVMTIIYDSTDEIQLESSKRSKDWKAVALSLDKKAPFGILGYRTVEKISGHFYRVIFSTQYQSDF